MEPGTSTHLKFDMKIKSLTNMQDFQQALDTLDIEKLITRAVQRKLMHVFNTPQRNVQVTINNLTQSAS